jgi:pyruvate formate lyase activating enzyme
VWFEITTLLIPGLNDSDSELAALARWICDELGPDVPLHFTAFHPDLQARHPATHAAGHPHPRPQIARTAGLHYVYTGNVHDKAGDATHCPGCGEVVIQRDWYRILDYALDDCGHCRKCGTAVAGRYEKFGKPFGPQRIPVRLHAGA